MIRTPLLLRLCTLAITLLSAQTAAAQDPIFSQFQVSKAYLNPAYTGINGGFTATVVEREQWGKITGNPPLPGEFSTQFASFEWNFADKSSLGGVFMNDTEGEGHLRTVFGGLNYSYVLPKEGLHGLSNFRLGFGMYYAKKWIDWDQLVFSDQLHPKGPDYFLGQSSHAQFFDDFRENPPWWTGLNIGFVYRYIEGHAVNGRGKQFGIGISSTHVLELLSSSEIESLQGIGTAINSRYTLHGSAYFPALKIGFRKNPITPVPAFRIDYQGRVSAFTAGADLMYRTFALGVYYQNTVARTIDRSTGALILTAGFGVPVANGHIVDLGLSYDFNVSGLAGQTGGVFEITLSYHIANVRNRVLCPSVGRAHRLQYENSFHKNPNNKNLN